MRRQKSTAAAPSGRRLRIADVLIYLTVRLVGLVIGLFPINRTLGVLRGLGTIWFTLPHRLQASRKVDAAARLLLGWSPNALAACEKALGRFCQHRVRAEEHIRLSFPDMREPEVSRIAHESFRHLAMVYGAELLITPRLVTPWTWHRYMRLKNFDEALPLLLKKRGCIMVTAHYGSFELLGYVLAVIGFDMVAVMRPLDNELLNHYLLDRREASGLKLLYKKGATRSAGDVLESGGALCFIGDQDAGSRGMFVDFFGRKASTYKSIGLLAMEYDVPIIVGYARRSGQGFSYEMGVTRIIHPKQWKSQDDPLRWITESYSQAMEQFIREVPEQYLWIHRRWKSKPREKGTKEQGLRD